MGFASPLQYANTGSSTKFSGSIMSWVLGAHWALVRKQFATAAHQTNPSHVCEPTSSAANPPVLGSLAQIPSTDDDTKGSARKASQGKLVIGEDDHEATETRKVSTAHTHDTTEVPEQNPELTPLVLVVDGPGPTSIGLDGSKAQQIVSTTEGIRDGDLDPEKDKFIVFWKPKVELIVTKGFASSSFVDVKNGDLSISDEAIVGKTTADNYKLAVSFDDLIGNYFIGMCFVDVTSLSFIPLSGCFLSTLGDLLGFLEFGENKCFRMCEKGRQNSFQNFVQIRVPLKEYRAIFMRIEKEIDGGMIIENSVRRYKGFAWILCEVEEFTDFHMFREGKETAINIHEITSNISRNWNLYGTAYLLLRVFPTPEGLQLKFRFRDFHLRKYRPCLVRGSKRNLIHY